MRGERENRVRKGKREGGRDRDLRFKVEGSLDRVQHWARKQASASRTLPALTMSLGQPILPLSVGLTHREGRV